MSVLQVRSDPCWTPHPRIRGETEYPNPNQSGGEYDGDSEPSNENEEEEEEESNDYKKEDGSDGSANNGRYQSKSAEVFVEELYYSDSDPDANVPDFYDDDSDEDKDSSSIPDEGPLPDLIPDTGYHPELPAVREHINMLFLQTLTSTSISTSSTPISAPQLVDQLVRQHLPQLWRYRARDKVLNNNKDSQSLNGRPRPLAMISTCVECGFRFHKQPLYDEPQRERNVKRKLGQRMKMTSESRIDQKANTKSSRNPARDRRPLFSAEYYLGRESNPSGSSTAERQRDNSELTLAELDNILNNNRRSLRYDGNLDYIGIKEERHGAKCALNKASAISKAKKIYVGWDLVPGHDHSTTLCCPTLLASSSVSAASSHASFSWTDTNTSEAAVAADSGSHLYPSRSLMASFSHLLPRSLVLSQNMIRKLFTYFIWHPWFDCDLQAITIRRAYSELWPLFLLRDEDDEVLDEEEDEFRKRVNTRQRNQRREAQLRKRLQRAEDEAGQRTGNKSRFEKLTTCVEKKSKRNDGTDDDKKEKNKDRQTNDSSNLIMVRRPRTEADRIAFERGRLMSLQSRFTTAFTNGLYIHGVYREGVYPSMPARARIARQVLKGWTLFATLPRAPLAGYSLDQPYEIDDSDNNASDNEYIDERVLCAKRKIYYYTADADETARTTESGDLLPETFFPDLAPDSVLSLTNHALTHPDREDALTLLTMRLRRWFRKAHRRRVRQGFILPEYMLPHRPRSTKASKAKGNLQANTTAESKPKFNPKPKAKTGIQTISRAKPMTEPTTETKAAAIATSSAFSKPALNAAQEPSTTAAAVLSYDDGIIIDPGEFMTYLTQPWENTMDQAFASISTNIWIEDTSKKSSSPLLGDLSTMFVYMPPPSSLETNLWLQTQMPGSDPSEIVLGSTSSTSGTLALSVPKTSIQTDHLSNTSTIDSLDQPMLDLNVGQIFGLRHADLLNDGPPLDLSSVYIWSSSGLSSNTSAFSGDVAIVEQLGEWDMEVDMDDFL
ncbi:hypothetical protein BGX28_003888 [Mortierella sp. GBA30]|nr:hypothetical protein BGX28_003888 [Mortierella sp. GBA30]